MAKRVPTTTFHPTHTRAAGQTQRMAPIEEKPLTVPRVEIPKSGKSVELEIDGRPVTLTNLQKPFWPQLGITKGDLLRYYAHIAPVLLPHLRNRAMVMKRYPHGAAGEFFFMKRAPTPRPDWIATCNIAHVSGNIIDFPLVQGLSELLWVVNLGCIDMNPWYARCDDVDRPDYMHFDLDPVKGKVAVSFAQLREAALKVRAALEMLKMPSYAKTTGSRGIHIYVPIERGPNQRQVWQFAKSLAVTLAGHEPKLLTAVYAVAKRPEGRVLVDYNQNAWGRTLASVYSVRPTPRAAVSAPVTWKELERGVEMEDFHLRNMAGRVKKVGDLFAPVLPTAGDRVRLEDYLKALEPPRRQERQDAARINTKATKSTKTR